MNPEIVLLFGLIIRVFNTRNGRPSEVSGLHIGRNAERDEIRPVLTSNRDVRP